MEADSGKQPDDPFRLSNKPHDVTLCLAAPIFGTGRNLTTDNWYTSLPLATNLLKRKVVEAMKKNKPDVLPEMMPKKIKFAFRRVMMLVTHGSKLQTDSYFAVSRCIYEHIDEETRHK